MKTILAAGLGLALTACGQSGQAPVSSAGTEPPHAPADFLGVTIGERFDLPLCSTYGPGGDYKVASLQEVTPCWHPHDGDSSDAPAAGAFFSVLFRTSDVPNDVKTEAFGKVDSQGALVRLAAFPMDGASLADELVLRKLLISKYGQPSTQSDNGSAVWSLGSMYVEHHPIGTTPMIIATARAFAEQESAAERKKHAASF